MNDEQPGLITKLPALVAILSLFATPVSFAQDGGQLYGLYCGACHGADGKGDPAGQFPPLASSPWVAGEPDRAIKIVLNGIQGPIEVNGKNYNLMMPPQGAALTDDYIAAILTHVRTSMGNSAEIVETSMVAKVREANKERVTPWTAEELLDLHPLPLNRTPLENLTSYVLNGEKETLWTIAKMNSAAAEAVEEEHDGIVSLKNSPAKEKYAIVWEGTFSVPKDGIYEFFVDSTNGASIKVGGKNIIKLHGAGKMDGSRSKLTTAKLQKGKFPIRIEYLHIRGEKGVAVGWRPSKEGSFFWLTEEISSSPPQRTPVPIEPENSRPVLYRNFIDGTTARAIGVGFPGGVNLAYSADNLAPEIIWTDSFIDGAYKWQNRGIEPSPPDGKNIIKLSKTRFLPEEAQFKGYSLDPEGNPTFRVAIGEQTFSESWQAGGSTESRSLIRTLELSGEGPSLDVLISQGLPITAENAQIWALGTHLLVEISSAGLAQSENKSSVMLAPGKPVTITYRWK